MTAETMTEQTIEQGKKRKRLTLEEQIARQEELLAKEKESLVKKQKRLRSLNASKMNKDRIQAQKKRNAMLIQLGLFFIEDINNIKQEDGFEFVDAKDDILKGYIYDIEKKIRRAENIYNKRYKNKNVNGAKILKKYITDKNILLTALNNLDENYLKTGKVKLIYN